MKIIGENVGCRRLFLFIHYMNNISLNSLDFIIFNVDRDRDEMSTLLILHILSKIDIKITNEEQEKMYSTIKGLYKNGLS